MFKLQSFLITLTLLFLKTALSAQTIEGVIRDKNTNEVLAFVHIQAFSQDKVLGGYSDIDGKFSLKSSQKLDSVVFTMIGYEKMVETEVNAQMQVYMGSSTVPLTQVEIRPKENPAIIVLKKVLANKDKNNPAQYEEYSSKLYNKQIWKALPAESLKKLKTNGNLMIVESISEKQQKNGVITEHVEASKISGFKEAPVSFGAEDLQVQQFHFYNTYFQVLDREYLNPISKRGFDYYQLRMKDTLIETAAIDSTRTDSIFVITFRPKKQKTSLGLEGFLHISNHHWAIKRVVAESNEGLYPISIKQFYSFSKGKWFPTQLSTIFYTSPIMDSIYFQVNMKTYMQDVRFDSVEKSKDLYTITEDPLAKVRPDSFWTSSRPFKLDSIQVETYHFVDSLAEEINLEKKWNLIEKLATYSIPLTQYFDLNLKDLYYYNPHEGHRVGIGLELNEDWVPSIQLGGFMRYGFTDEQVKYGGHLGYKPNPSKPLQVGIYYENRIQEIGQSTIEQPFHFLSTERFAWQFYAWEEYGGWVKSKINKSMGFTLKGFQVSYSNLLDSNESLGPAFQKTRNLAEIQLRFKKSTNRLLFGSEWGAPSKFPVIQAAYLREVSLHKKAVQKLDVKLTHHLQHYLGHSKYEIQLSYNNSKDPVFMHTLNAGFSSKNYLESPGAFQSLLPYQFITNRAAQLYVKHRFYPIQLFKYSHPTFWFSFRGAIGDANISNNKRYHFETPDRGIHELGVGINQLIRVDYLNLIFLHAGVGVYKSFASTEELLDSKMPVFLIHLGVSSF